MVTTVSETIGSGQDHADIATWLAATDSNDLVADDEIREGVVVDSRQEVDANDLVAALDGGGTRSATQYRHLKFNTVRYRPHAHQASRVYVKWLAGGTGDEAGLKIEEDYFHVTGVAFICEDPGITAGATTAEKSGIHIEGDGARLASVFCRVTEGGALDFANPAVQGPTFRCFHVKGVSSGNKAADARFFNCIAMGSPYGHGASTGFHFHNWTTDGGTYNCAAYQIRRHGGNGFLAATAVAAEFPEVVNCIAIDAGTWGIGTSGCIKGGWSRFENNMTSDLAAQQNLGGSTGVNSFGIVAVPDLHSDLANGSLTPTASGPSHSGQAATSIWTYPHVQDFRLKQATAAVQGGSYEGAGVFATANGGPGLEDYLGTERETGQIQWNIGPIDEIKNAATTSAPTVEIDQIGPGETHTSVQDWLDDTEDRHLLDENKVLIGELRFNGSVYDQSTTTLRMHRAIGDATHYRMLRSVDEHRANPTTGAGTVIQGEGASGAATIPVIDISEHHFRMQGIRVDDDYAGAESRRAIRVRGDDVRLDALWVTWDSGTGSTNVGVEVYGSRCLTTNVLCVGLGDSVSGMTIGFLIRECLRTRTYCCVADKVDGDTQGVGFREGSRATLMEVSSCIATNCATGFSNQAGKGPTVQDHNISDDATADGPGSQTSVSASSIWTDPTNGDYRLKSGSPAEKAGANLQIRFDVDFLGVLRRAPFDIGIFEGIGFAQLLSMAQPARSSYLATCWEIQRTDGVSHYFTDASGPIPHAGRTYVPAGGFNASNRRAESGTGEASVSVVGAVTSDAITEADLKAGRFRGAIVKERLIDWRQPWRLPVISRDYTLAGTKWDGQVWRGEMLGLAHILDQEAGENLSVGCPADLGDDRCGKDISADIQDDVRVSSTIQDVRRQFNAETADISAGYADDYFGAGRLIWLTGANAGIPNIWVKNYTSATRTIELENRMPFDIVAADTFQVWPGCRKRYILDCITKHANGLRFRGDPFHPGTDNSLATPQR